MKKTAAFVLAILASLAFLVNPGFGALPRYEITDLGTLGGGYGYAGAIDNAAALAGDSCIIDSVNADEIQVPNAFWSASELGWLYTPGFSYILTGVLTNLGNSHIDGTSPLVTLEVYDGLPVEDANLLRSAQFHPADRSWAGGHFDPLVLTAGEHYFIGFRNVKDLWASHSYDGVPLPIYYGYDNDGTYPFTENGDVEYAMLKFQGTHIHPLRVPVDYPTIQAAIDAAVDGDTVLVADGTYTGEGNRDIDFLGKAITVRSENGPENCIIDCQASRQNPHRGFRFSSHETPESIVDGFMIVNGYAPIERVRGYDYEVGGAIFCHWSSPTIRNCIISNNDADYWGGGGIYCTYGSLIISNTIFEGNSGHHGGGILCDYSDILIDGCIVNGNGAYSGGGIYIRYNCSATIVNSEITGNHRTGINCYESKLTLDRCVIANNRGGGGGGVWASKSDVNFMNCLIAENYSTYYGGGMEFVGDWREEHALTITNCTVVGNEAGERGGGVLATKYVDVIISNSILWNNTAREGEQISLYATIHVNGASTAEIYYSVLEGGIEGIYYPHYYGGYEVIAENCIDTDPMFTDGYHLQAGSPCIDAGDPNYIADPNETDLDGNPRVIGGRIDMGAFEYRPVVPAKVRIVPRSINLASKGKWITCYISLPEDYNVADIDTNSVLLEDEIQAQSLWLDEEEQVAIAKFGRSAVQGILNIGWVELTITGQLADGTVFKGTDVIRVIDKGGRKSAK